MGDFAVKDVALLGVEYFGDQPMKRRGLPFPVAVKN
jgi:hypothetical protein